MVFPLSFTLELCLCFFSPIFIYLFFSLVIRCAKKHTRRKKRVPCAPLPEEKYFGPIDSRLLSDEAKHALYHVSHHAQLKSNLSRNWFKKQPKSFQRAAHHLFHNARIVIHVSNKVVGLLSQDGFYRNQFETGTSHGCLGLERRQWESTMFACHYDNSKPFNRCKYGRLLLDEWTLNSGMLMQCCRYGYNYLVLKPEIKRRCTCTWGDSSQCKEIGTLASFLHFLPRLKKEHYLGLMEPSYCPSAESQFYVEVQIHGPVHLSKDVDFLVLNQECANTLSKNNRNRWRQKRVQLLINPLL